MSNIFIVSLLLLSACSSRLSENRFLHDFFYKTTEEKTDMHFGPGPALTEEDIAQSNEEETLQEDLPSKSWWSWE